MRPLCIGLACLAVSACSQAPDHSGPGENVSGASGVAFAYHYYFRLPSSRISGAQEAHAQACEQLGVARCRVTGMTYRLDGAGQVSASLDVRVAAALARRFGRDGVQHIERSGGALTGAEINGTDAGGEMEAAQTAGNNARTDLSEIEAQLSRPDLPDQIRRDLLARRSGLVEAQRTGARAAAATQARLATTPITFVYRAGTGVGLTARFAEAGQAGYASLTWTLATALTLLAYAGPPLILLFLAALLWHWFGRGLWKRAFPKSPGG